MLGFSMKSISIKTTEQRVNHFKKALRESQYTQRSAFESLMDLFCALPLNLRMALVVDPTQFVKCLTDQDVSGESSDSTPAQE